MPSLIDPVLLEEETLTQLTQFMMDQFQYVLLVQCYTTKKFTWKTYPQPKYYFQFLDVASKDVLTAVPLVRYVHYCFSANP